MKNKLKFLKLITFVMMIGISTVAYSDIVKNTNGSLTISGFPSTYHGKWVFAEGDDIAAASNVTSNGIVTLGQISNSGSVTLKVWQADWNEDTEEWILSNYNGNDTIDFEVAICNKSTFSESLDFSELLAYGDITVTFNNGTGSGKMGIIILEDD